MRLFLVLDLDSLISSMMVRGTDESGRVCWQCSICSLVKSSKCNMAAHIETRHVQGVAHHCPHCGTRFRTRPSLGVHLRRFHLGTEAGMKGSLSNAAQIS